MQRALLFLPLVFLAGCGKGSREAEVHGEWTSPKGGKFAISSDHTFQGATDILVSKGTWTIEGDDVTLVDTSINGKTLAEVRTLLTRRLAKVPSAKRTVIERILKNLDKPDVLKLSADGKSMTTDKAKDPNGGESWTLNKA